MNAHTQFVASPLALLLALVAQPALAQSTDAPITTMHNARAGTYLVGGNGSALYLFAADTRGARDGSGAVSTCVDSCIGLWTAVIVEGKPVAGAGVEAALLGTLARPDGLRQLTYNGWPMYFYGEDAAPGDIKGNDLESYGADWYLIAPNGERAKD